jgi:hypothetical protein
VKSYRNSHRIRLQRDVELTTGQVPDVQFYQPELFSSSDCSLPLPCSLNELREWSIQLSIKEPSKGCSDSFLTRVSLASNIAEESIESANNINDALQMYIAKRDLLHATDKIVNSE